MTTPNDPVSPSDPAFHAAVERFLYQEARLLDTHRLEDWLALFTDWDSLYACCGKDQPWNGMVQPSAQAFDQAGMYSGGAIINPAGPRGVLPMPQGSFARFAR